ncbi:MAG TPA: hypothetical protein VM578_05910 [Candidatus Saccharimonadales bacterium]|nr:hypothetical protein [Candidatus Saccharimonadales bacterium]
MSADANREGFRLLRHEPALFAMELLWRWSFGLGLLALCFFAYARLRQAVLLSDADQLALAGQDPFAVAEAAKNILAEAMPLLLRTFVQIFSVASILWIACAALGRGIITRLMVRRLAADYSVTIASDAPRWTTFAILMFARVLMLLILVIGYLGGVIVAGMVSSPKQNPVVSGLIVFASLSLAVVIWSYVNWVLSLAPIFVVRDALSPVDSVVAAIAFIRRNSPRLTAISLWNGTARGVIATLISIAGVSTAALHFALPSWAISALLVLETLVYFVVSDVFLVGRLAAYSSVAARELAFSPGLSADHSGIIAR